MKALAWGDLLCGVEVTPETWMHDSGGGWLGGAIIEFTCPAWGSRVGGWEVIANGIAGYCRLYNSGDHLPLEFYAKIRRNYIPIYPPKGFAGLNEAELWEAVFETNIIEIGEIGFYRDKHNRDDMLEIRASINLWSRYPDPGSIGIWSSEADALILALQNAQVLSNRLRSAE